MPASVRGPAGAGREQQAGGGGKRCGKREGEQESERAARRVPASGLRNGERGGASPRRVGAAAAVCALFGGRVPRPLRSAPPPVCGCPGRGLVPASRSRSPLARPSLPPRRREPSSPARRRRSAAEGGSAPAAAAARPARARAVRLRRERSPERAAAKKKKLRSGRRSFPARGRPAGAAGVGRSARPSPPRGVGPASGGAPRGAATWLILPVAYACLKD